MLLRLCYVAALVSAVNGLPRVSIPFDFGWRHLLGNPGTPGSCSPADFTQNLTGVQCLGLSAVPGANTTADCIVAACAAGAAVYQTCKGSVPATCKAFCFVGGGSDCVHPSTRFDGAGRTTLPPPIDPAPIDPAFDDSAWVLVDAPHDALISTPYSQSSDNGQASIPRNVTWYRKHFVLPAAWRGSHVEVYFEGAFAYTYAWLNGVPVLNHTSGYTSFALRLDNVSGVAWGGENVLSLFIDATVVTGWWYEGGGLFRPTHLVRSSGMVRIADDGVFAPSRTTGAVRARATPAEGLTADAAIVLPHITVESVAAEGGGSAAPVYGALDIAIYAADGTTLLNRSSVAFQIPSAVGSSVTLSPPPIALPGGAVELWSVPRPYLHVLTVTLSDQTGGAPWDAVSVTLGVRDVAFDAATGLALNGQRLKARGFCNHANFAGVGGAVPARVDLLRLQQLRGVGANAWRMAHNPANPATYAMADALGVMVLDENRVGGGAAASAAAGSAAALSLPRGATPVASDVQNLGDMVRRDRQHASVIAWSTCNEVACSPDTEPTLDFVAAANAVDGTRVVTANMMLGQVDVSANATELLGAQGFSHESAADFAAFHTRFPAKPLWGTECCGCKSQRGEDADLPRNASVAYYDDLGLPDPACVQHPQFLAAYAPDYSAGLFVWTLNDYYGEPNGWPHISASHGQIDLAGFPKAPSYWYRAQLLAAVPASDPGRPPVFGPGADTVVHIVERWQPAPGGAPRAVHVYSSAPFVRLAINGAAFGVAQAVQAFGWALFPAVPFVPGTLTAQALAADGVTMLATHDRRSWGPPAAVALSVDAPAAATGTGSALYLDGSDVALVRATIVDAAGNACEDAAANVSFSVVAGPGLIAGVGNGDPASHDPNAAAWRPAYHGLARALVRVTLDAATPDALRALRAQVDVEAGRGPRASAIMPVGGTPPTALTVAATAPGLVGGSVTLPLSVRPVDAPLAVAAASVATAALQ